MQIGFVCLVAPAFGGGVWALGFLRGATRRKIPEPPCRGKRDLRAALRVAGFRPLIVAVGCEPPVRNFANRRLASWWDRGGVQAPPRTLFRTVIPAKTTLFSTIVSSAGLLSLRGVPEFRSPGAHNSKTPKLPGAEATDGAWRGAGRSPAHANQEPYGRVPLDAAKRTGAPLRSGRSSRSFQTRSRAAAEPAHAALAARG